MATMNTAAEFLAELSNINFTSIQDDLHKKQEALALAKKLTLTLESPIDRVLDFSHKPFSYLAIRMAVGLNLFEHICAAKEPISSAQLSKISGGEELLITRILRVIASINFVNQPGPYTWLANPTTHTMALPPIAANYRCEALVRTAFYGTDFLAQTSWRNPTESRDGIFQFATQTKLHLFDYLQTQPALFADFNLFMGAVANSQKNKWDWWDIEGRLIAGFDATKSDVLLVDVGGGKGHDIQDFQNKFGAKTEGKLVLQDLPKLIKGIKDGALESSIVKMGYDFFEEQPVKGARCYYLHHVLHDWPDKYCLEILAQVRKAMTPGYSKLVVHDLVLPDTGASELQARFDLAMMTINSGMERSALQFRELLASAGFKVTGVWSREEGDGIVEAEVEV
ncbi:sterigmatocystin 8-O-methyltransferase [Ampelomyces quisqualis]|uniref:Sterigmatocystin 8-O-methyltransferase n=1 Tax=Ampelomyces quisqualis TaxID=50730 RepID=A0A6A5QKG5_AMPQU|nr:sterigmatocystin 8-O-methyltransferase [Ampelomyces quisqualis]